MKWPWNKLETRADTSYTDVLIQALVGRVSNNEDALPTATGALEACAGMVGRSFASAEVEGPEMLASALSPDTLEIIGRSMIRRGEVVFLIDTGTGKLRLLPAQTHDVMGGPDPDRWEYNVTVGGPSETETHKNVPATSVLHFRYAIDPERPWRGNSPLGVARLAGRLSAETVNALANESSGPVGQLLGLPVDGEDPTIDKLKEDIAKAKGRMAFLEIGDWGAGGSGYTDIQARRFGANPGEHLVLLAQLASREVYAACGMNSSLFGEGDAASTREAWRLLLFGVVAPLGRKVEHELQMKLEDMVTLEWQELRASDIQGRARSFKSFVDGGLSVESAAKEVGLKNTTPAPPKPEPEASPPNAV